MILTDKKIAKTIILATIIAAVILPSLALAKIDSPEKVIEVIEKLSGWMYSVLIVLAVVFIILAAYQFLMAGGDSEKVTKAKNSVLYAVLAVTVAVLATGIVKIVEDLLM